MEKPEEEAFPGGLWLRSRSGFGALSLQIPNDLPASLERHGQAEADEHNQDPLRVWPRYQTYSRPRQKAARHRRCPGTAPHSRDHPDVCSRHDPRCGWSPVPLTNEVEGRPAKPEIEPQQTAWPVIGLCLNASPVWYPAERDEEEQRQLPWRTRVPFLQQPLAEETGDANSPEQQACHLEPVPDLVAKAGSLLSGSLHAVQPFSHNSDECVPFGNCSKRPA